ncbi:MAG: hypothetical protein H7A05_07855 [Pseudomonadales bacterium]|nr:hypothetical protein [Pseudomonadales bacterium]MCP5344519.1 hypothetical protein [Pseudomonadales bacterium]
MSKGFRKLAAFLAAALLLLAEVPLLHAQDGTTADASQVQASASADDGQNEQPENQTGTDADAPELAQSGDDDSGGSRFIPTEQLSQDLGASFPVDI